MRIETSVIPPDDTTLFTTSGMQKHKPKFGDPSIRGLTLCDSQTCFRTVDLDEVGDGTHALSFRMLGLFSFRDWDLIEGMLFWKEFLERVGLMPDRVTVHPDKQQEHRKLWESLGWGDLVEPDEGCRWSDGSIGGYCTELYQGGVEIGNIVNPMGDCLDCGFGLERIGMRLGLISPLDEELTLRSSCELLLEQGIRPGSQKRDYVLRRIMRRLIKTGSSWDHPLFLKESQRVRDNQRRYQTLRPRHPGMSPEWWWQTHGIDLGEV